MFMQELTRIPEGKSIPREVTIEEYNRRRETTQKGPVGIKEVLPHCPASSKYKMDPPRLLSPAIFENTWGYRAKLFGFGVDTNPLCLSCGVLESPEHILLTCTAIEAERAKLFRETGHYVVSKDDFHQLVTKNNYPYFKDFMYGRKTAASPTYINIRRRQARKIAGIAMELHKWWKDPWRRSRLGLLTLAFLSSLCFASFLLSQRFVTTLPASPYTIGRSIQSLPSNELTETVNISQDIEDVLLLQKEKIVDDILKSYHFPGGPALRNQSRPLSDLVPALGGQPLRSVIIATWRSGSTFLGDILNSVPGNFYHYEPLLDHGIVQVRGPPRSKESLRYIRNLLTCNYTDMEQYLSYGQDHTWLFTHNTRLWEKCSEYPHLCWLPIFLNRFCSLFPFQSMKLVRLRLKLAEELLTDEKLGVKVVLVVRDPRGTMQSRRHRDWCPGNPDCDDPTLLCADLVADYSAALNFKKKYPKKFKIVRYEDFSLDPYKGTEDLFKFLGVHFGPEVKRFLDTHTKANSGGVSSTFRNSKNAPFHWRMDLSFSQVQNIQRKCSSAMDLWGYTKAVNASHQKYFDPIKKKYSLKP